MKRLGFIIMKIGHWFIWGQDAILWRSKDHFVVPGYLGRRK